MKPIIVFLTEQMATDIEDALAMMAVREPEYKARFGEAFITVLNARIDSKAADVKPEKEIA